MNKAYNLRIFLSTTFPQTIQYYVPTKTQHTPERITLFLKAKKNPSETDQRG